MSSVRCDVLIIGGGVMGASAAYFLKTLAPTLDVVVVEPDPSYRRAATPRASGGIRQLFSCPENVQMSRFSLGFYERFAPLMETPAGRPDVRFQRQGYLFVVPESGRPALEASHRLQRDLGVNVLLLDPAEVRDRFPALCTDDLALAAFSPDDGWLDPAAVLHGFLAKARSLGVRSRTDAVVDLDHDGVRVRGARLASGDEVRADVVINAAGAWADQVCDLVGMPLPVRPLRRFVHSFTCPSVVEPLPFVKDPQGLALRPDGHGYTAGLVDLRVPRGFDDTVDERYFPEVVWPALARRVPAFAVVEQVRTSVGFYDQNDLDGNMILGSWPGLLENFLVAAGFSGHGLMHAPAVGRALAELTLYREFRSLDLTRLGYQRVVEDQPYREAGIL